MTRENDQFELNDRLPKLELYNYMVNQGNIQKWSQFGTSI